MKTRLANMILEHWRSHQSQMVAELEKSNTLAQAIQQAEMRAAELLYQNLAVHKMQYQTAWDLAMQECLRDETTSSKTTPTGRPPATSA